MDGIHLTGRATVDRPWMKYYPPGVEYSEASYHMTMEKFFRKHCKRTNEPVIEYYGHMMSFNEILDKADLVARGLKAAGVKEGEHITMFLQTVPEFLMLLLGAEKIGAVILCRDGTPEENVEALKSARGSILFAHDYLSKEEEEMYYEANPELKHIILVSPFTYAKESTIPMYIMDNILSRYPEEAACSSQNMTWQEFLKTGEDYKGEYLAKEDPGRTLYGTYTSGSTGPAKLLFHSAETILGGVAPLVELTPNMDVCIRSLHMILPPALVAVVGPMISYAIATNKLVMLDPFCTIEDADLEIMRYKPNTCTAAIPQIIEQLVYSKRVPKEFKMDHVIQLGGGADPVNNKRLHRIQKFLDEHGCKISYTMGYGMSESAGLTTCHVPSLTYDDCAYGIPVLGTVVGIFDAATQEELDYGQIGEICRQGPGTMLGYDDPESTAKALQRHKDGKVWLHTGDFGYITEEGVVHVMSRGLKERYGGGYLFPIKMENTLVEIPGVEDGFFVIVRDKQHEGFYEPYLYLILEAGVKLEDVEDRIYNELELYERPVKITVIKERPYYHFKVARIALEAEIDREREREKTAVYF